MIFNHEIIFSFTKHQGFSVILPMKPIPISIVIKFTNSFRAVVVIYAHRNFKPIMKMLDSIHKYQHVTHATARNKSHIKHFITAMEHPSDARSPESNFFY